MTDKSIYITGMFRSGTTLLGKCLSSHPKIALALDPMLEVFREVRNHIAPDSSFSGSEAPFGNDFWLETSWKKNLKDLDLRTVKLNTEELNRLKSRIIKRAEPYSPRFTRALDAEEIESNNIKDLLLDLFSLIENTYGGKKSVEYIGFKEVWGEDYAPSILNNFNNAKVIHIIRDPRAVVSSKLAQEVQYPYLFLTRFWRKSALLSAYWSVVQKKFSSRYKVISFEELVREPEKTLRDISDYLDLNFSSDMLDYQLPDAESVYESGANSSYQELKGKGGFSEDAIDKWKDNLDSEQKKLVKWLTYPEIAYKGYIDSPVELFPQVLNNPPEIPYERLADWLKPYQEKLVKDKKLRKQEYAKEFMRRSVFELDSKSNLFSEDLINYTFYDLSYFNFLRKKMKENDQFI